MSQPDYVKTTFIWHSMGDACQQCAYLNGNVYDEQSVFQSTVWDPFYGDIWNLDAGHSMTHGGTGINCRCTLEVRVLFDWDRIRELGELQRVLHTGLY